MSQSRAMEMDLTSHSFDYDRSFLGSKQTLVTSFTDDEIWVHA